MNRSLAGVSTRIFAGWAALLLSASAWAINDCELNGEAINTNNGAATRGKTGLLRCKDRNSGLLQREQELRDGEYIGLVRFYKDGKLSGEHSVNARGNRHGRAREFAPDGQVLVDSQYDNGSTVGVERRYHPNGQIRSIAFYAQPGGQKASAEFNDRGQLKSLQCAEQPVMAPAFDDAARCGFGAASQLDLFRENGQLAARARYESGKRVHYQTLYENGTVSAEEQRLGDRRVERRFYPDGVKRQETESRLLERGARRERELEYSAKGTLIRERRWDERDLIQDHEYYLNGQPKRKSEYSTTSNQRIAEVSEFFDNGKPSSVGRYQTSNRMGSIPVGTHRQFHIDGKLIAESIYDDKGRISRERGFDEDGKVIRDDEVFEDGSRKAYSR